ncbi:hypothetical protein NQ534_06690 [Marvinbryantia formatexigens DSM 14469]|nr:hypothetical protein [Marvinbryantia formatexigens]UWO26147.1 hypothetical protein NQ534_06690 [Marvinbryantia formatexigens DSM 14469]
MYAADRCFCLGNLADTCEVEDIKKNMDKLLVFTKKENEICKQCWARKICHFCPAHYTAAKEGQTGMVEESICQKRRKRYERILLKSV